MLVANWIRLLVAAVMTLIGANLAAALIGLSFLLVRPWSINMFRRTSHTVYSFYGYLTIFTIENVLGITSVFSGDEMVPGESMIVTPNHQTFWDHHFIYTVAQRAELTAFSQFFCKDEIKYYFGWGLAVYAMDFPLLDRDWTQDMSKIKHVFRRRKDVPKMPLCLTLFPEGHRVTPKRLADSQEFAKSRRLPQLKHLLYPRFKGLWATIVGLEQKIDSIVDISIGFPPSSSFTPSSFFWGTYGREIHYHVRRYSFDQVPRDMDGVRDWIYTVWESKDRLMDHFNRHGSFPGPQHPTINLWSDGLLLRNIEAAWANHAS